MKTIVRQCKRRAAFTIVELLTVMSIIVILIGLLVPALNRVRIYAKTVTQNAQFHSIEAAIELFNNEFEGYPDSGPLDSTGVAYCGAMKLCEAMMGQDTLGFHSRSLFKADGYDNGDPSAVPPIPPRQLYFNPGTDLTARKGPYLPPESADAVEVGDIWTTGVSTSLSATALMATNRVLCDVYTQRLQSGKKVGMPILYFKANTRGYYHDPSRLPGRPQDPTENIYNYWDNRFLVRLGRPGIAPPADVHAFEDPLENPPDRFYKNTENPEISIATGIGRPFRADTYILISAGYDGDYGTADDIMNFKWDYRP
ncbi:MAG: type II secretion system protein [Sedimentisphaerales bacterium]|nr:type II secretion system protein [Sedimentisphaerales bacterium]